MKGLSRLGGDTRGRGRERAITVAVVLLSVASWYSNMALLLSPWSLLHEEYISTVEYTAERS